MLGQTRYRVDVAIELEQMNAGFIEILKENDVRQMSRCRNRILQWLTEYFNTSNSSNWEPTQTQYMCNKTSSCIKEEWLD